MTDLEESDDDAAPEIPTLIKCGDKECYSNIDDVTSDDESDSIDETSDDEYPSITKLVQREMIDYDSSDGEKWADEKLEKDCDPGAD